MGDRINAVLAAAAAEGRQHPLPADELAQYGHAPVPPTMRCQECGRRLVLVERIGSAEDPRIVHDPWDGDGPQ